MIKETEAIQITNSYFKLFYSEDAHKVQIPIYRKKWKLWMLDKLVLFRKKRAGSEGIYQHEHQEGVSNVDYSKIIWPDSWVSSHTGYVAFGVEELKYVYVMGVRNAFLLENTKYGMRPMGSYDYSLFGKPQILIDKDTREIYDLGLDFDFKEEEDFNKYKEHKTSKIDWSKYKV